VAGDVFAPKPRIIARKY